MVQNSHPPAVAAEPITTRVLLQEMDLHWANNAGLRANTRKRYLTPIRRFLTAQFPAGDIDWAAVTPTAIAAFVTTELQRHSNRSTQRNLCTAIRCLLRYVQLKYSFPSGTELLLPRLPQWRQAALPQALSDNQLETLLTTCSGHLPGDVRCRSLLLLFTRLGMRTGEVAALSIDDIDWIGGSILIKGSKNRRDRSLPLPFDVGEALVAYLRNPRPPTAPRVVFPASLPPFSSTQNYNRVRAEIRKLLRKAGIRGVRLGAHVLRHTSACTLVNNGASFKEVADVLGHKSLQTTAIYAKLDLTHLAAVALPWNGGGQ
jgi:site-specific recombinase XerD